MSIFTSSREKRLWIWVLVVLTAIISSLFVGQPLARYLSDQNLQFVLFLLGMLLVGATILVHALKSKTPRFELALIIGLTAVYAMFFFRLGAPERSHMIEYSVLAIFIHKALAERASQGKRISRPAVLAVVLAIAIGVIDESIQLMLPNRVFDPLDIVFNSFVVIVAISTSALFNWMRHRRNNLRQK